MKDEIVKEIMRIMKEKQVARKVELFEQVSKKKKVSKKDFEKIVNELIEKNWIKSIYGGNTTFALTQSGLKESKLK
ncbi:MAG: hypothetical protein NZ893_01070 [Candidatus Aenigmarchaeota archaeon]|nr:hypothetical protein [Candidatus Aenigmarchaeota archaeon]